MPWVKGQSGNPAGRKKGSGATSALREQVAQGLPKLVEVLMSQALKGDLKAAEIILDRVWPRSKAEPLPGGVQEQLDQAGLELLRARAAEAKRDDGQVIDMCAITRPASMAELVEKWGVVVDESD